MENVLSREFDSLQQGLDWIGSHEFSVMQFHGMRDGEKWSVTVNVSDELELANSEAATNRVRLEEEKRRAEEDAKQLARAEQQRLEEERVEVAMHKARLEEESKRLEQERLKAETESRRLEQERVEAEATARRNEEERLRLEEASRKLEEEKMRLAKPKPEKPSAVYFFDDPDIGPVYVGESIDLDRRLYTHVQNAIKQSSFAHWLLSRVLQQKPIIVRFAMFPSERIAHIMEWRLRRRFSKHGYTLFNDEPVSHGAKDIARSIQRIEIDTRVLIEEGFVDGKIVESDDLDSVK